MKQLLVLSILTFTLSSFACEQYEAQFGGVINEATQTDRGCVVDFEIEFYNEHFFCPLLEEEVHTKKLLLSDESCESQIGQRVGGILIFGSNGFIEIEK